MCKQLDFLSAQMPGIITTFSKIWPQAKSFNNVFSFGLQTQNSRIEDSLFKTITVLQNFKLAT